MRPTRSTSCEPRRCGQRLGHPSKNPCPVSHPAAQRVSPGGVMQTGAFNLSGGDARDGAEFPCVGTGNPTACVPPLRPRIRVERFWKHPKTLLLRSGTALVQAVLSRPRGGSLVSESATTQHAVHAVLWGGEDFAPATRRSTGASVGRRGGRGWSVPCHDPQFYKIGGLSALGWAGWELADVL